MICSLVANEKARGKCNLRCSSLPKYDHLFRQEMKKTFTQGKVKVSFCMHHWISLTAFEFTCCESLVMSTGLILLKAESLSSLSLACCSTAITKASWTWLFSANSLAENTVNGIRKGSLVQCRTSYLIYCSFAFLPASISFGILCTVNIGYPM